MHIEPGMVDASKIILSYATAATAITGIAKLSFDNIKNTNVFSFLGKTVITSILVFVFFEVFPHYPIGVSEVHLILGSTLFLLFGVAPAGVGLAIGLLIQGLFFAPFDLPQYGMNITTLLVPLMAISYLAKKIIPQNIPYTSLKYADVLKMSLIYQGGIVAWVTFWALYGQGIGAENLASILSFGAAYMSIILIEPIIDLSILAIAKTLKSTFITSNLFEKRLYKAV